MQKLDIKALDTAIKEARDHIEPCQNRAFTPFIGLTGAGKSTTICYLLGCKFKQQQNGELIMTSKVNKHPMVGHDPFVSETLYPNIYEITNRQLVLVDTPGILENRGPDKKIAAYFSIREIMLGAPYLHGFVITLDYPSLLSSKGENFQKLALTLASLLDYDDIESSSILVVITKTEKDCNENKIKQYLEKFQEALLHRRHQIDDTLFVRQIKLIRIMRDCPLFLIDVTSNLELTTFFDLLKNLTKISTHHVAPIPFSFEALLMEPLNEYIMNGLLLFQDIDHRLQVLKTNEINVRDLEKSLSEIPSGHEIKFDIEGVRKVIASRETSLLAEEARQKLDLETFRNEIQKLEDNISAILGDLSEFTIWSRRGDIESVCCGNGKTTSIEYNDPDIPASSFNWDGNISCTVNETNNRTKLLFKITGPKSCCNEKAIFRIEVKALKKHTREGKNEIKRLQNGVEGLKKRQSECIVELNTIEIEKKKLKDTLVEAMNTTISIENRLENYKQHQERLKSQKVKAESELEESREQFNKIDLTKDESKFVISVIKELKLTNSSFQQFLNLYHDTERNMKNYADQNKFPQNHFIYQWNGEIEPFRKMEKVIFGKWKKHKKVQLGLVLLGICGAIFVVFFSLVTL